VVRAVRNDPYSSGKSDISTTRLIDPPQKVTLEQRFSDFIMEDVSDRLWSLRGQAMHVILERAAPESVTAERRYFAQVLGWTISGQVDIIERTVLVDYKDTSVWTIVYKSRIKEWTAQANVNRWLAHVNGVTITKLENMVFLRDWSRRKALQDPSYPQAGALLLLLDMWTLEEAEKYVLERVRVHQDARVLADDKLPECTTEERWAKETSYAVKKPANKTAWRVFSDPKEAEANAKEGMIVEVRPGENTRCEDYCNAAPFCAQARRLGVTKQTEI
jgi:hypothetical protein